MKFVTLRIREAHRSRLSTAVFSAALDTANIALTSVSIAARVALAAIEAASGEGSCVP